MENVSPIGDRPPGDDRTSLDEAVIETRIKVCRELKKHEQEEHGGEPCWSERTNIVAYFCHVFQLSTENLTDILHDLDEYRKDHRDPSEN